MKGKNLFDDNLLCYMKKMGDRKMLKTEMRNEESTHIDKMDTISMLKLIHTENANSVRAVEAALEQIATVCDLVAERISRGGRIIYIGAGTSGRLGVMDAAECPPTYGVSKDMVVGIIAGGDSCLRSAAEAQEDDPYAGQTDLKKYDLTENDIVIGLSASGGAAYVVGALEYANQIGAVTVSLTSNWNTPMEQVAQYNIVTDTGPEVITGSTRMKSGNAQKMVLNMISTAAMVKTGKVYENLMINLKPSNQKLRNRMIRIVCEIMNCTDEMAENMLAEHNWDIRRIVS